MFLKENSYDSHPVVAFVVSYAFRFGAMIYNWSVGFIISIEAKT